jgi:hypothetical protein
MKVKYPILTYSNETIFFILHARGSDAADSYESECGTKQTATEIRR